MKILVTGGAGYLGSILVPYLLKNHQVTVVDSFMYGQDSLLECCANANFNVIKGDVRDVRLIRDQIPKHDAIIPLAAIVGMPACKKDPILAKQVNYEAIRFIAETKSNDQLMLFPNTNSGYGQGEGAIFNEESELNPISVYGTTKVEAEKIVRSVENTVVFRLATVFGVSPRMRLDLLVNDFTHKAWRDGYITLFEADFKRNYVHVRDVSRLFEWSIDNFEKVKGDVFNFGLSNANLSKMELCMKIKEFVPNFEVNEAEVGKDPDQRNYIVINDKIESRGLKAHRTIEQGIQELLKSFNILQTQTYTNL